MYKELSIENFKIFAKEQRLKIAPFTLIYGENGSGKSTLLKAFDLVNRIFINHLSYPISGSGDRDKLDDLIKNLSPNRIHYSSSQLNKKPIKIEVGLDIPISSGSKPKTYYGVESFKRMYHYTEQFVLKKYTKEHADKNDPRNYQVKSFKKETYFARLNLCLHIKYFPGKKISQISKIEIKNKNKIIIAFDRINRQYGYILDPNEYGFIKEKNRKKNYNDYLSTPDYISGPAGYVDYRLALSKDTKILEGFYNSYKKIFNTKKKKRYFSYLKMKLLFEFFRKNFFVYINPKNKHFAKKELFNLASKIILRETIYSPKDLNSLLERINKMANNISFFNNEKDLMEKYEKKILGTKKYNIEKFSEMLSNLSGTSIILINTLLNSEKKLNQFAKIVRESFSETFARFKSEPHGMIYPKYCSRYEKCKQDQNKLMPNRTYLAYDVLYTVIGYIMNGIFSLSGDRTVENTKASRQIIKQGPHHLLTWCLIQVSRTIHHVVPCNPSLSNVKFDTIFESDIDKFLRANNIKNILAEKNKITQSGVAKHLRKYNKVFPDKWPAPAKNWNEDPNSDYMRFNRPEHVSSEGMFFDKIVINNPKIRGKLNRLLKKFLNISIVVKNVTYLEKFPKEQRNTIKNIFIEHHGKNTIHNFKDKFLMIKDLRFKKKFNIHGIEIGKGPANILTFLLQLLDERSNIIYAVQELENNWHPKFQGKLINMLTEVVKKSRNKSIILETHSELFILKIQKLVQKGILRPKDVSINYISRSNKGLSEVINIPLNSQGGFEKSWPGGFFNERMEILSS
tara:strand:- start:741 stop:3125 length:2385 start_codon:yes stop_codon:yes gene_type:complete